MRDRVNDKLYRYYPLSVGTAWIYRGWTHRYVESGAKPPLLVKQTTELAISVSRIYTQDGAEYVELNRAEKIVGWYEVLSEVDGSIGRRIPFPNGTELEFNSVQILKVDNESISYIDPDYPDYIDVFPMTEGVLADLGAAGLDPYKSAYGEDALIWKRERSPPFTINNRSYDKCFRSYIYDLRGNSGSENEIVFCEGLGPVGMVSELLLYPHHSYYNELVGFRGP